MYRQARRAQLLRGLLTAYTETLYITCASLNTEHNITLVPDRY
jgi:hypothetical protein